MRAAGEGRRARTRRTCSLDWRSGEIARARRHLAHHVLRHRPPLAAKVAERLRLGEPLGSDALEAALQQEHEQPLCEQRPELCVVEGTLEQHQVRHALRCGGGGGDDQRTLP